jgi:hypothetical protein
VLDERRSLYAVHVPEMPAIVLVPDWSFTLVSWQIQPFFSIAVVLRGTAWVTMQRCSTDGRTERNFVKVTCAMTGYHVFRWRSQGELQKVNCAAL